MTVECWFNRQTLTTDWNGLVCKAANSSSWDGWGLIFGGSTSRASLGDVAGLWDLSSAAPISNQWHHYAMQYDGTNFLVWIDGSVTCSNNATLQLAAFSYPIHIGCEYSGWRPFQGWIAEVRISKAARYSGPFIPQARFAADTNTIALYHFDEGQGTTVADSSGNGNNGTVQGTGAWSSQVPNVPYLNLMKAVKPAFSNLALGTNYQLQVSADINNWTNQGSAFTATNTSMVYPQYWDVDNWNQLFFRLQVAP